MMSLGIRPREGGQKLRSASQETCHRVVRLSAGNSQGQRRTLALQPKSRSFETASTGCAAKPIGRVALIASDRV